MLKRTIRPGRILKDELEELGVTPSEFARRIRVPPNRVSQIINGKRAITGDTALRLQHIANQKPRVVCFDMQMFVLFSANMRNRINVPNRLNKTIAVE